MLFGADAAADAGGTAQWVLPALGLVATMFGSLMAYLTSRDKFRNDAEVVKLRADQDHLRERLDEKDAQIASLQRSTDECHEHHAATKAEYERLEIVCGQQQTEIDSLKSRMREDRSDA